MLGNSREGVPACVLVGWLVVNQTKLCYLLDNGLGAVVFKEGRGLLPLLAILLVFQVFSRMI